MTKEDLVGAIVSAVQRGSSLQQAMQSLYNAGYNPNDIDEAARAYLSKNGNYPVNTEKTEEQKKGFFSRLFSRSDKKNEMPATASPKMMDSPTQKKILPSIEDKNVSKQIVSEYSSDSSEYKKGLKKKSVSIFLLIIFLLLLAGVLTGLFLFREEFISWISNFI